ncbi:MAG: HPr kinase/phosphatase C-terminal domain-containing protein [Sphingomonadaceae bacterium]|nr:HPr kinase/phosphatase C-terminal domain-containing protein [Sphingomonadaceae bacterium]
MTADTDSATVHASCVAIRGRGVLLFGPSGSGKSDLALRLIDRGAVLVSDDYTVVTRRGDALYGRPPARIAGAIEVRGIGILPVAHRGEAPLALAARLDLAPDRMPEPIGHEIVGLRLPLIAIAPLEPSAPIKVELALERFGLATE